MESDLPKNDTQIGPIAEALRLLRIRTGLTQTAAGSLDGAPDFRTLSHWETRRKYPSLKLLIGYLQAMNLDFHDLQDALNQVKGFGTTVARIDELDGQIDRLARAIEDLTERRQVVLELRSAKFEVLGAELASELTHLGKRVDSLEGLVRALDREPVEADSHRCSET